MADASSIATDTLRLVFGASKQGAKAWQEDSFFSYASPSGRVLAGAVFDGHGGFNGMLAAIHSREAAEAFFRQHEADLERWSEDEWRVQLREFFSRLHSVFRDKLTNPTAEQLPYANPRAVTSSQRFADEKGVVRQANGDPIHGGTTASLVVYVERVDGQRLLVCANVGDSDAILIPQNPHEWKRLSEDHGPDSGSEWQRIQSLDAVQYPSKLLFIYDKNNVFRKYSCPLVFRPDGQRDPSYVENPWGLGLHPTNVRYEPAVYAVTGPEVTKDTTCIAMTRSIGDFYAHPFGLTWEPTISIMNFPSSSASPSNPSSSSSSDSSSSSPSSPTGTITMHSSSTSAPTTATAAVPQFVAVATDGVWDCWRFELFAEHVLNQHQAKKQQQDIGEISLREVTTQTVDLTIKKAIESFGAKHYDDASLVLIRIPPPQGPLNAPSSSPSASPAVLAANDAASSESKQDANDDEPTEQPFKLRRAVTLTSAPEDVVMDSANSSSPSPSSPSPSAPAESA